MKVNPDISSVDGIPYDTLTIDVFPDRVRIQPFRTWKDDDALVVAAPPIDIDMESWDKLHDYIATERGK